MLTFALISGLVSGQICWQQGGDLKCSIEGTHPHGSRVQRAGGRQSSDVLQQIAPVGGTGGFASACACTNVTTASGSTITWTRAGSATCSPLGLATTGITTNSITTCASNLPRVESDGTANGVRSEKASQNDCLQSEDLATTWTASAAITTNTTTSPFVSKISDADTMTDSSAVAAQGVSQVITTAAARKHSFSCYVMAGTLSAGTISMTGTGSATGDCSTAFSGLSGATYSRVSCYSAAAYAGTLTAVTVSITAGAVAADTGTLIVTGCQHESGDANHQGYVSSYIPTTTAAASRIADTPALPANLFPAGGVSITAFVTPQWVIADLTNFGALFDWQTGSASGALWFIGSGGTRFQTLNGASANLTTAPSPAMAPGVTRKIGALNAAGFTSNYEDGALIGGPTATNVMAGPGGPTPGVGYSPTSGAGTQCDCIISRMAWARTAGVNPQ